MTLPCKTAGASGANTILFGLSHDIQQSKVFGAGPASSLQLLLGRASSQISMPKDSALVNFEPAEEPATSTSKALETLPTTHPCGLDGVLCLLSGHGECPGQAEGSPFQHASRCRSGFFGHVKGLKQGFDGAATAVEAVPERMSDDRSNPSTEHNSRMACGWSCGFPRSSSGGPRPPLQP